MSLIWCKECGRAVSELASFCPGCGWPVREMLQGLETETIRSRFRFNPLARPGKLSWLLAIGLVWFGRAVMQDPAFPDKELVALIKPVVLDPWWFFWAAAPFFLRGIWLAVYWACDRCGGMLPQRKVTRCPYCHRKAAGS